MNKKYQVLRCGRLYDGVTQEWKSGQSILVEDHLIAEVDSEVSVPEGADIIDLSDCQVTPGIWIILTGIRCGRKYTPRVRKPKPWQSRAARKRHCAEDLPLCATWAALPAMDTEFWM